jgi:hypothetical protein
MHRQEGLFRASFAVKTAKPDHGQSHRCGIVAGELLREASRLGAFDSDAFRPVKTAIDSAWMTGIPILFAADAATGGSSKPHEDLSDWQTVCLACGHFWAILTEGEPALDTWEVPYGRRVRHLR